MDVLSQIEQKYGFKLPSAYRSFAQRGYLTYPGDSYLWVSGAEWVVPADILDNGAFYGDPQPGLIAFAFDADGSVWAWQTRRLSDEGEPVIAHCPRDCEEGWWHAPSFLGWLYRVCLEYASAIADDEPEPRQNLRRWSSVLGEFDQRQWADVIQAIAERNGTVERYGVREQYTITSLVSESEVNDLIHAAFGPGFIDAPYVWTIDGEAEPS